MTGVNRNFAVGVSGLQSSKKNQKSNNDTGNCFSTIKSLIDIKCSKDVVQLMYKVKKGDITERDVEKRLPEIIVKYGLAEELGPNAKELLKNLILNK